MRHFPRSIPFLVSLPLLASLLAGAALVPRLHAKKTTIRASWDKAKSIHENGDFKSRVQVVLRSTDRLNGQLVGMTAAGLRLQRQGSETLISRGEVHAIRFVSRKMDSRRNRLIALVAGVPAGFFAGHGVAARFSSGCCDFGKLGPTELIMYGTWAGVQYVLYRIGARADREVLLVVLDPSEAETSE